MSTPADPPRGAGLPDQAPSRGHTRATWLAGLIVAAGAAVLTAHGLIEVALGCGVPAWCGWLYPVITDGLALVAYAATTQLAGAGRRYAWSVVTLAAGLSGLAQAAYLVGGVREAGPQLRFLIGSWPAMAAAIAAHLLYLIGTSARGDHGCGQLVDRAGASAQPVQPREPDRTSAEANGHREALPQVHRALPVDGPSAPEQPTAVPAIGQAAGGEPGGLGSTPAGEPDAVAVPRGGPMRMALAPIDRARMTADLHRRRSGQWPSVRELQELAGVGRGTAHNALKELRDSASQPGGGGPGADRLHLVGDSAELVADADADESAADPRRTQ
jgi:hypothetical protein